MEGIICERMVPMFHGDSRWRSPEPTHATGLEWNSGRGLSQGGGVGLTKSKVLKRLLGSVSTWASVQPIGKAKRTGSSLQREGTAAWPHSFQKH